MFAFIKYIFRLLKLFINNKEITIHYFRNILCLFFLRRTGWVLDTVLTSSVDTIILLNEELYELMSFFALLVANVNESNHIILQCTMVFVFHVYI